MKTKVLALTMLFFSLIKILPAQTSDSVVASKANYLKIYLDGVYEYSDYIKQHVTFVNYVRDRFEADVHLLVTSQSTGSGGTEYTLFYLGQLRFAGKNDTFKYVANTNNTDETREQLTSIFKLGLMRYVAYLPEANKIKIAFDEGDKNKADANPVDHWKNWVFSVSADGFGQGEKSSNSLSVYGNLSADKVTDEWKINLNVSGSIHKSHYDYNSFIYDSKTDSKNINALIVKSITDHWSLGGSSSISHSTYSNYDLLAKLSPAVEYDIFPYSKSTSKTFTFLYEVTPSYQIYIDTTLYNKKEEFLVSQSLRATLVLQQKWGSVSTSLTGSNYFHDFSKNQLSLFTRLQWRIVGGLSMNLYGGGSIIHDQLNLPGYGATDEEVLTQQKELSTSYNYFASFGISYTFGSIYNNVVNPRFGQ
ncbi:MAG: hypothetical protein LH473_05715 [Chitinophagales bacterium]|nr:hypothetical protein [Chitinophagales bacterium]